MSTQIEELNGSLALDWFISESKFTAIPPNPPPMAMGRAHDKIAYKYERHVYASVELSLEKGETIDALPDLTFHVQYEHAYRS